MLCSSRVNLDNIALVPASLLPFKAEWQQLANGLPAGGVLICVPERGKCLRETLSTVAGLLRSRGRRMMTLPTERFA